jgi:hypothetical protein
VASTAWANSKNAARSSGVCTTAWFARVKRHSPATTRTPAPREQVGDPLPQPLDDPALPLLEGDEINIQPWGAQPRRREGPHAVDPVGELLQRLAGQAAVVQAHPAETGLPAPVDEGDAPAEMGGVQRGGVAPRPAADDQEVDRLGDLADDHQDTSRSAGSAR